MYYFGFHFISQIMALTFIIDKDTVPVREFKNVIFAGTFDRLHAGHFAFFEASVKYIVNNGLIQVGFSGDALLQRKSNKQLIFPIQQRMDAASAVIIQQATRFNKQIQLKTFQIDKPEGNCLDEDFEDCLLLVSEETAPGVPAINAKRLEKGFQELSVGIIKLVVGENGAKLSSSDLRK